MIKNKIVVIIPTYNNETTILTVVNQVALYLSDIIVINDGSTDETGKLCQQLNSITLINFPKNLGKGAALKEGFTTALNMGFTHAITIDADGQHLAEDIPLFLAKIEDDPNALWIGERKIPVDTSVKTPLPSKFGHAFGEFWYTFFTGLKIKDNQSGFRAYPLQSIKNIHCKGSRYEFEIEILIKAAWSGIPVKTLPVHLLYFPKERRVSHFRPIRDFLRIGKVNFKASLLRIFIPSQVRTLPGATFSEKIKNIFLAEIRQHTSPSRAALSVSTGIFFGLTPLHGLQVGCTLASSIIFSLNKPLALLGVNISIPPLLPFWIALSIWVGKWVFPKTIIENIIKFAQQNFPQVILEFINRIPINSLAYGLVEYVLGSMVVAFIGALASFTAIFLAMQAFSSKSK